MKSSQRSYVSYVACEVVVEVIGHELVSDQCTPSLEKQQRSQAKQLSDVLLSHLSVGKTTVCESSNHRVPARSLCYSTD